MKIVAVIPAFNEEKTIKKVIERAMLHTDEVILVDDGSTDKTYEEALNTGAIIIIHKRRSGVGRALKTGIEKALSINADLIVTLDADGEHNPDDIPRLVQTSVTKAKDIIIGSRFVGHNTAYHLPMKNRISNKISTLLLRKIFRARITDSQSGFRVYRSKVFKKIDSEESCYLYLTDVLIKAIKNGFTIEEVPIISIHRSDKLSRHSLKEVTQYISLLLRSM